MAAKIISCRTMVERLDLQIDKAIKEKASIERYIALCESMVPEFDKVPEPVTNPHEHFLKIKLRKDSRAYKVREIILSHKTPMHINEIYKELFNTGVISTGKIDSLRGNLNGMCEQLRVFVRVAPCVYGLMELGHK
jgi:hypothetical protein